MNVNRRTKTVLAIIIVIVIAVFAITSWQRGVATKRLLDELPGDDYAKVMDAMIQLQERSGRAITPALLDHLASPRPAARWRAATLLGDVGTRRAWDPLSRALGDESPEVRAAVALALGKLGAVPAASGLERVVGDKDEHVSPRIAAAQALGLLAARDAVGGLRSALGDRLQAQKAFVAAKQKAAEDAREAVGEARETLAEAETEEDREAARTALDEAREKADEAAEAAREAETTYPEGAAALARTDIGPAPPGEEDAEDAPAPPTDKTWEVRAACARALGMIAEPETLSALAEAVSVSNEPHAEVRVAAAYALGDMARRVHDPERSEALVRGLISALDDKQVGDVRAAALHSLGFVLVPKHYEKQVERALAEALEDDFYWSREAARESMRRLNIVIAGS